MAIYTAGHSSMAWDDFLRLVQGMELLLDVRSHPTSRHPQFDGGWMRQQLGARYLWSPGLGGWDVRHLPLQPQYPAVDLAAYGSGKFPKQRIAAKAPAQDGPAWTNVGLLDYAWYQSTGEFREAAEQLQGTGRGRDVCMFCCEAVPWRCHRSLISDYLAWQGRESTHLLLSGRRVVRKPHSGMLGNRLQRYPAAVRARWEGWVGPPRPIHREGDPATGGVAQPRPGESGT